METISVRRHTKEEIRKADFGLILERAMTKVGFLSCALLEYPQELDEKVIRAISSILDGIGDELREVHEGHFKQDENSLQ
jgi:hypothetical protein